VSNESNEKAVFNRRQFIAVAITGTAAFTGGALMSGLGPSPQQPQPMAHRAGHFHFAITEALVEMVDHTRVYHWAFEDLTRPRSMPQMPGPLVEVVEGDEIQVSITNSLTQVHGFRIPGVPGEVGSGVEIAPGATVDLTFTAPDGGSYMYFDHLNSPVNRVLGLHGPMIVLPAQGNTPYSQPTPAVQRLFDDLGTTEHFPGEPWHPDRTRVWLHNSVDPRFNEMAQRGESIDADEFTSTFLPRYFTLNGLSGAYAAHDHSVVPHGHVGQPHVIRLMNAGMCWHSPHLHANHFHVLARVTDDLESQEVQQNVVSIDSITMKPLERMDWLHPFIRPPDIPGDPTIPLRDLAKEELDMVVGDVPLSPMSWPMHCHMEMSQTAAGGNYPQGVVAMWELTGDLDGVDFPHSTTEVVSPPVVETNANTPHDLTVHPVAEGDQQ